MTHQIVLVGAPSSAGAYAPGQEKAPAAFRRHGLLSALEKAGLRVRDDGDVESFRWRPDLQRPKAMNVDAAASVALAVGERVARAFESARHVIVLGGDCTVELGTVAGAIRTCDSVGLIYIDLDVDLNTPETSDGALDWTGVAHLLDIPGAAAELARVGARRPMLGPQDVLFLAANEITAPEAATIDRLGLRVIMLQEVRNDPHDAANRVLDWAKPFDRLLIHVDADVLSYAHFPIAENVRRGDGLRLEELGQLLKILTRSHNFSALTLTEINPDHAPDEGETFSALIRMLCDAMQSTRQQVG